MTLEERDALWAMALMDCGTDVIAAVTTKMLELRDDPGALQWVREQRGAVRAPAPNGCGLPGHFDCRRWVDPTDSPRTTRESHRFGGGT